MTIITDDNGNTYDDGLSTDQYPNTPSESQTGAYVSPAPNADSYYQEMLSSISTADQMLGGVVTGKAISSPANATLGAFGTPLEQVKRDAFNAPSPADQVKNPPEQKKDPGRMDVVFQKFNDLVKWAKENPGAATAGMFALGGMGAGATALLNRSKTAAEKHYMEQMGSAATLNSTTAAEQERNKSTFAGTGLINSPHTFVDVAAARKKLRQAA